MQLIFSTCHDPWIFTHQQRYMCGILRKSSWGKNTWFLFFNSLCDPEDENHSLKKIEQRSHSDPSLYFCFWKSLHWYSILYLDFLFPEKVIKLIASLQWDRYCFVCLVFCLFACFIGWKCFLPCWMLVTADTPFSEKLITANFMYRFSGYSIRYRFLSPLIQVLWLFKMMCYAFDNCI